MERACDAKCNFCITNFREPVSASACLNIQKLEKILAALEPEKIEITGGGEPTLHPAIDEIIDRCCQKAPTQLYTHGARLRNLPALQTLTYLCISRAHYDDIENQRIMSVAYDFQQLQERLHELHIPLKLSLLLHYSGIHSAGEVHRYVAWAQGKAEKVVLRQLFEQDYQGKLQNEFISSEKIFRELGVSFYQQTESGNPLFQIGNLKCEVEMRSCACEMNNPVLHADGKLYRGWSTEPL